MTFTHLNTIALRLSARRRRLGVSPQLVVPGVYFPTVSDREYQPCCDRVSGSIHLPTEALQRHLMSFEHCRYRVYAHLLTRLTRKKGATHDHD